MAFHGGGGLVLKPASPLPTHRGAAWALAVGPDCTLARPLPRSGMCWSDLWILHLWGQALSEHRWPQLRAILKRRRLKPGLPNHRAVPWKI